MSITPVPKIAVSGLEKSFGKKRVLDGLDIACGAGESLVIIGGSGTGKSVLIKCILGVMRADTGSIRIDGMETARLGRAGREKLMRRFGMLFQGSALFDSLSVWENVAFGLIQGRGMERRQAHDIALTKLASVGLAIYGVKATQAASWAIGFHILSFIPITLIGIYYFSRLGLSFSELRAQSETSE